MKRSRYIVLGIGTALLCVVAAVSLVSCQSTQSIDQASTALPSPPGHHHIETAPAPSFPLPAPRASATTTIPLRYLSSAPGAARTLGAVADQIDAAIAKGGYYDHEYLPTSGGFAVLTRLERINPDGSPRLQERFNVDATLPRGGIFSISDYLKALLTSDPGYYRIVVFVVTRQPVTQTNETVTPDKVDAWFREGADVLPEDIRRQAIAASDGYHCTALIYEFEKARDQPPHFLDPSAIQGRDHLAKAGVWDALVH